MVETIAALETAVTVWTAVMTVEETDTVDLAGKLLQRITVSS